MPVWFAYRSFDHGPTGKHLKRFEDDTVLDWFRSHWDHLAIEDREVSDERLAAIVDAFGFRALQSTSAREGIGVAELREAVRSEAPESADRDFETAFVAYLQHRGH